MKGKKRVLKIDKIETEVINKKEKKSKDNFANSVILDIMEKGKEYESVSFKMTDGNIELILGKKREDFTNVVQNVITKVKDETKVDEVEQKENIEDEKIREALYDKKIMDLQQLRINDPDEWARLVEAGEID